MKTRRHRVVLDVTFEKEMTELEATRNLRAVLHAEHVNDSLEAFFLHRVYLNRLEVKSFSRVVSALAEAPVAQGTPLTIEALADSLDAYWNGAIGSAHHSQDGMDVASVTAVGMQAVANQLREHIKPVECSHAHGISANDRCLACGKGMS